MKKILIVLIATFMCLAFVACGKSQAAQSTDDLITSIGTVTLDSGAMISAAETAYEALSADDKAQVENYATLLAARATYDSLVAKQEEDRLKGIAADMDAEIANLASVELTEEAVVSVRNAYNALEEGAKQYVTKLGELEAAEAQIIAAKVAEVESIINAIGNVTLDSAGKIQAAKDAYNALSSEAKEMVSNKDLIANAEEALKALKKSQADTYLAKMKHDNDFVQGIDWYYTSVMPFYEEYWGADVRCFMLPYLGIDQSSGDAWLRLIFNYTDDDWVFFDNLIIAADGERYTESLSYWDVTRDNDYGDVWEYVDLEVRNYEIEMLWAVVNSNTTVIRFQGDDYSHDFTVSASDKQAIKEMLIVYEALSE